MEATSIGKSTIFEGKIQTNDLLKIDGTFKGELIETSRIITGKDSLIEANIRAENVAISGTVIGNIAATKTVDISQTGDVRGDIVSPVLNIAAGSKFKGNCKIDLPQNIETKKNKPLK